MALNLAQMQTGSPIAGVPTNRKFCKVCNVPDTGVIPEYVISTEAQIDVADTDASLSASSALWLEKGTILYFGANKITLAESKTIAATATTVAIDAAATQIATATDSSPVYGMISFPAASIDGFNPTVTMVDGKASSYIDQSSGLPTQINVGGTQQVTITGILRGVVEANKAHHEILLPNSLVPLPDGFTGDVFAMIGVAGGMDTGVDQYEYLFGVANVMQSGDPLPNNEARRPAYQLNFTPETLKTTIYEAESVARKAKIVEACKLAGILAPS